MISLKSLFLLTLNGLAFFGASSFFIFSAQASASSPTDNAKLQVNVAKPKPPESRFNGSVNLARYGSLVDHQDGTRMDSLDTSLSMSYMVTENYKLGSLFYYSQNLKTEMGDWDDANLSFSRKAAPLFSRLLFSPAIVATAPMSKDSRIRQEYLGGIGAAGRFSFQPGTFVGGLDFKFSISLSRNSFQYETATNGKPNNQYSSVQKLVATQNYKKLTSSIVFFHINTLSFQNELRESFMHMEELSYEFSPRFSAAIGHANVGSALKPNGQDNNILLINENSSAVYVSTTVSF